MGRCGVSAFSGPQGKGATRALHERKHREAVERDADVTRVMHEQNITRPEAQRVAKASRRVTRAVTAWTEASS